MDLGVRLLPADGSTVQWQGGKLVNAPASSGGASAKSISLTFTGSFPAGTYFQLASPVVAVPTTQGGPTTYSESAGVWLGGGSFTCPALSTISFTDTIGIASSGSFILSATTATSVQFPLATTFASSVSLTLAAATTVSLPNLAVSTGTLSIAANALTAFSLPAITTIATLTLTMNGLTSFSLPSGVTVGTLTLTMNAVTTLSLTPAAADQITISSTGLTSLTIAGTLTTMLGAVAVTAANLASFTANSITSINSLSVNALQTCPLTTYSVTGLTTITNGKWALPNSTGTLTTLAANAITTITGSSTLIDGAFSANNTTITTISASALTTLAMTGTSNGAINLGGNGSSFGFTALTTLTLTNFATISATQAVTSFTTLDFGNMTSLVTLSLPALANALVGSGSTCPFMRLKNMGALTTLSLGALATVDTTGTCLDLTSGTGALTTLTFGAVGVTKKIGGNIIITSAALNQASVDGILARLVALDGTSGTTLYTGAKTVTITGTSSTPSATGLTNKATLVGRGITVTTN